jgi:hypothetical protein
MDTEHMKELLLPNEKSFQNDILDVTIEETRFVCYPYTFPEVEQDNNKKRKHKNMPHSIDYIDIRAFCVIFALDSYQSISQSTESRLKSILRLFTHTLIKEEFRSNFIGREAQKLIKSSSIPQSSLVINL